MEKTIKKSERNKKKLFVSQKNGNKNGYEDEKEKTLLQQKKFGFSIWNCDTRHTLTTHNSDHSNQSNHSGICIFCFEFFSFSHAQAHRYISVTEVSGDGTIDMRLRGNSFAGFLFSAFLSCTCQHETILNRSISWQLENCVFAPTILQNNAIDFNRTTKTAGEQFIFYSTEFDTSDQMIPELRYFWRRWAILLFLFFLESFTEYDIHFIVFSPFSHNQRKPSLFRCSSWHPAFLLNL